MSDATPAIHLRLRHPDLDFWVDARLRLAGAYGSPLLIWPELASRWQFLALWPLGPDIAADLVNEAPVPTG